MQNEEERPQPGQYPDRNLEAGLPIDSRPFGVLFNPTLDLSDCFRGISLITGQKEGLSKSQDVLMAVQFVNGFRVAPSRLVHRVVVRPEAVRPYCACDRVLSPIDLCA